MWTREQIEAALERAGICSATKAEDCPTCELYGDDGECLTLLEEETIALACAALSALDRAERMEAVVKAAEQWVVKGPSPVNVVNLKLAVTHYLIERAALDATEEGK